MADSSETQPLGIFSIIIIAFLLFVVFGVILGTIAGATCEKDHHFQWIDNICASK